MTFQEKAEELLQEVFRARASYEAWWGLTRADWTAAYPRAQEPFSEYFGIAIHTHFVSLVLALHRLYDYHRDALSLPNLEVSMQSEAAVDPALRTATAARIGQARPMLTKVRVLRNRLFGHRDRAYTIEQAFAAAGLTPDELANLTQLALETINPIVVAGGGGNLDFDNSVERDVNELLRTLESAQLQRPGV